MAFWQITRRNSRRRASPFALVDSRFAYYPTRRFLASESGCNMPENAPDKRRGRFKTMVWKPYPDIEKSAGKYRATRLFKSDRAIFVYFFVVMMIISTAMAVFWKRSPVDIEGVLWEVGIFGFLSIFILMGHVWAMGFAILTYTTDKILLMMPPISAQPLGQIIFGLICSHLGSTAIRVEMERKRRAESQAQTNTRQDPPTING